MKFCNLPHTYVWPLLALAISFNCLIAPPKAQAETKYCWIDAKTGKPAPTYPWGWEPINADPNHVSKGGHTSFRAPDGTWTDAATGQPVPTYPWGWEPINADPNHVSKGGRNFVRVPCPSTPKFASKKTHAVLRKTAAQKSGLPQTPGGPTIMLTFPMMGSHSDDRCKDQIGMGSMGRSALPCR